MIYYDLNFFRMGKIIAKIFSATLLTNLLGATSLVCILGYQILTVSQYCNGDHLKITFNIFTYLKKCLKHMILILMTDSLTTLYSNYCFHETPNSSGILDYDIKKLYKYLS